MNSSPADALAALAADPDSALIDVRTRAEWTFTGMPDLAPTRPGRARRRMGLVPGDGAESAVLRGGAWPRPEAGLPDRLFFICRSGRALDGGGAPGRRRGRGARAARYTAPMSPRVSREISTTRHHRGRRTGGRFTACPGGSPDPPSRQRILATARDSETCTGRLCAIRERAEAPNSDRLRGIWRKVTEAAERELGREPVKKWLKPVALSEIRRDLVVLTAPSSFAADWVERNYGLHLLRYLQSQLRDVRRLTVEVEERPLGRARDVGLGADAGRDAADAFAAVGAARPALHLRQLRRRQAERAGARRGAPRRRGRRSELQPGLPLWRRRAWARRI